MQQVPPAITVVASPPCVRHRCSAASVDHTLCRPSRDAAAHPLLDALARFCSNGGFRAIKVVAYDFGIKHNILRWLASYGCKITVVPSKWPASETPRMNPDGVLFSNGPGDPAAVPYAVETVKELIGKIPVFGICMGHQLLGQALGGKTFKMKFGHHGGNHPVGNLRQGRVEISAQNHNYAVDPASLPVGVEVTHINLNDKSCAGLACPELKLMSLQ